MLNIRKLDQLINLEEDEWLEKGFDFPTEDEFIPNTEKSLAEVQKQQEMFNRQNEALKDLIGVSLMDWNLPESLSQVGVPDTPSKKRSNDSNIVSTPQKKKKKNQQSSSFNKLDDDIHNLQSQDQTESPAKTPRANKKSQERFRKQKAKQHQEIETVQGKPGKQGKKK